MRAELAQDMARLRRHALEHRHVPGYERLLDLVRRIGDVQDKAMVLVKAQELTAAWTVLRGLDYETDQRLLLEELDRQDVRLEAWTGDTLTIQQRYTHAALWCLAGFTPVFLIVSVVLLRSTARNIRANRAAQAALTESARTLEALLDATTDRVILADRVGRILSINAAGARGLGLSPADILGRTFTELFPESVAAGRLAAVHEAMATGQSLRFSDERGGIVFDHIIAPLLDADGTPRGAALFARDITDIVRAREAAEAANRAKSEFLATISHEIRTPLNGILGMAQVLAGADPNEYQRQCLEDIQNASEGLLSLVTHILELSRLEAGLETQETNVFALGSILQAVEAEFGPQARAKGLESTRRVADDVPLLLCGDGDRLRRVLEHLLANAVKFTPAGSIAVEVTRRRAAGSQDKGVELVFVVRDTGIGIDAKDQARIFESFVQADGSATRRFGGSGLGLAIASRLVEGMGGVIRVESAPGQGSAFTFTLRFGLPEPETEAGF